MSRDARILAEIADERRRQDEKWGPPKDMPSFDQDLMHRSPERMAEHYEVPTEARAKFTCDTSRRRGECTMAHILVEEVAEVIGSHPDGESATRDELIQVAAVCVKWIRIIDARAPEDVGR